VAFSFVVNCYGTAQPNITYNLFGAGFVALPDYRKSAAGTPIIWGEAGAAGVTHTLTFEALAAGSARMGAYADLGEYWDQEYAVWLIIESGSAPTAGGTIDLYLPCSYATSGCWPGGVTGSDGAWPSDGDEDQWAKQLGIPVVFLVATNDANTIQVSPPSIWRPPARYVVPVVDNNWDQAVRDEATATDNDSRVIIVPKRDLIQDAA